MIFLAIALGRNWPSDGCAGGFTAAGRESISSGSLASTSVADGPLVMEHRDAGGWRPQDAYVQPKAAAFRWDNI
jgi:hypothetical protein